MPFTPRAEAPRCAVVDLGSNSVRLVVFEGLGRNPRPIFNEKAVLRLGRGLQATGRLDEAGAAQALTVMGRYAAIAHAMGAAPFEVLATAAVRDASNGPAFVDALRARMPGVPIRVVSGAREAELSAAGLACGIAQATGVLADLGGGSLELVRIDAGRASNAATLPLGVIRLSERAGEDPARARAIAEADLATVGWLGDGPECDLYAVGGAWRALARIHIAQTRYPLKLVHHYTIGADAARDFTAMVAGASRRALAALPDAPRRRVDDLPYAAVALRRVLRATKASRVVFSANGLREGWYMERIDAETRAADPMLEAARDQAARFSRDPALPPALIAWTAPLFPGESGAWPRLRAAACWLSDTGVGDHPEYRAEQAFRRILTQPSTGLDHHARAFLGLAIALRYDAEPEASFLAPTRALLGAEPLWRATVLGMALRLAYTLSAGTPDLLAGTTLHAGQRLTLRLAEGMGVFAGESVTRRLDRLAQALGLDALTERAA